MPGTRPGMTTVLTRSNEALVEIFPTGVLRQDQAHLPSTRPVFHIAFALNPGADIIVPFRIYEPPETVALSEALGDAFPMLPGAKREIVGHGCIERTIRTVRHDVNPSSDHISA